MIFQNNPDHTRENLTLPADENWSMNKAENKYTL